MSEKIHIVCPSCNGTNNIPKDATNANCGRCKHDLLDPKPIDLNGDNFNQHIQKNDIPVIVDYWAPWCGPCKMMAPVFEQVSKEFRGKVRFTKLNTENEQSIAGEKAIRSIPTLILYKDGKEFERVSGALDATALKQFVSKAL